MREEEILIYSEFRYSDLVKHSLIASYYSFDFIVSKWYFSQNINNVHFSLFLFNISFEFMMKWWKRDFDEHNDFFSSILKTCFFRNMSAEYWCSIYSNWIKSTIIFVSFRALLFYFLIVARSIRRSLSQVTKSISVNFRLLVRWKFECHGKEQKWLSI
jgi:hypothetical protein